MSWNRVDIDLYFSVLNARYDNFGSTAIVPANGSKIDSLIIPGTFDLISHKPQFFIVADKLDGDIAATTTESESGMSVTSKPAIIYRVTYGVITGPPDFKEDGTLYTEESGTKSGYFRQSSIVKTIGFNYDGSSTVMNSPEQPEYFSYIAGNWSDFESFYTSNYASAPYTCMRGTSQSQMLEAVAMTTAWMLGGTGPLTLTYDANNLIPSNDDSLEAPFYNIFSSLSETQKRRTSWPFQFTRESDADLAVETGLPYLDESSDTFRDLRTNHQFIDNSLAIYPEIRNNLITRYKTKGYLDSIQEAYLEGKFTAYKSILESTREVPRDFRIRTQAAELFSDDMISAIGMPTSGVAPTSTTTTTTTTTAGMSSGTSGGGTGGSY